VFQKDHMPADEFETVKAWHFKDHANKIAQRRRFVKARRSARV